MHKSPTKIHAVILILNLKSHFHSVFQSSSRYGFLLISHSAILEFTEFSGRLCISKSYHLLSPTRWKGPLRGPNITST